MNISIYNETSAINQISSYINLTLFFIGIIENSFCIYAFSRRPIKVIKFNLYLLVLASIELIFCFILFFDYLFQLCNKDKLFLHQFNRVLNVIFDYFVHSVDSCSVFITLILSIDRLYAIMKPLKIKNFVTNLYAKRLMLGTFLIIILLKIPSTIFSHYHESIFTNISSYSNLISILIFNELPAFVILTVNAFLIKEIIKSFKNNPERSQSTISNLSRRSIIEMQKNHKNSEDNVLISINRVNFKPVPKTQKSHHIVIIIVSFWLVLATIVYYSFNTFIIFKFSNSSNDAYLIDENEFILRKIKSLNEIQNILSIFFNSTHCINFFVYLCFYPMFRKSLFNIFSKISTIFNILK